MKKIVNIKNNGITLIALIITIIMLLILIGIVITQLTQNELFVRSELAKTRTEYTSAKEIIEIKLMEVQTECGLKNNEYTIEEITKNILEDSKITIEKCYYKDKSSIKPEIEKDFINLKGIVVSVNEYSKYKFLIGEHCKIEGITRGEIPEILDFEYFRTIEEFEQEIGISNKKQNEIQANQNFLILNGNTYIETEIKEEDMIGDNQEFTIATRVYLNKKIKEQGEIQMGILGNHNSVSGFAWQFDTDGKTLVFVMKDENIARFDYSSYYDKWTDLVATYSNGCIKVYADGQLIGEKNDKKFIPCSNLYIGTSFPPNRIFMGAIQTVKIWNSELSELEVNNIDYNSMETRD